MDSSTNYYFCPTDAGTVVFSYTYAPATYQVAAKCLGSCTEEYTLPDDNPVVVVNSDLWTGDAGVTLAGVPLTPIPYSQPNPIYPARGRPGAIYLLQRHLLVQPPGRQPKPRRPGDHLRRGHASGRHHLPQRHQLDGR